MVVFTDGQEVVVFINDSYIDRDMDLYERYDVDDSLTITGTSLSLDFIGKLMVYGSISEHA